MKPTDLANSPPACPAPAYAPVDVEAKAGLRAERTSIREAEKVRDKARRRRERECRRTGGHEYVANAAETADVCVGCGKTNAYPALD